MIRCRRECFDKDTNSNVIPLQPRDEEEKRHIKFSQNPFGGAKADNSHVAWYVLVTKLHQETQVSTLLQQAIEQGTIRNLFDVYLPQNRHIRVLCKGQVTFAPLLNCRVFVYGTQQAVGEFIRQTPTECSLYIDRTNGTYLQVPEPQMRCFIDFNTFHVEELLVLERPFADYARVQSNGKLNMRARVIDGPFAGMEGVLVRIKKDHRLVFEMGELAVSIPSVWDYHLVRVVDPERDSTLSPHRPERLADFLMGQLQVAGFPDEASEALHHFLHLLHADASLRHLAETLRKEIRTIQHNKDKELPSIVEKNAENGKVCATSSMLQPLTCPSCGFPFSVSALAKLACFVEKLSSDEASALLTLAHCSADDSAWFKDILHSGPLRPFLTPTAGIDGISSGCSGKMAHAGFDEYIVPVEFEQLQYSSKENRTTEVRTVYYAHVGLCKYDSHWQLFADWSPLHRRYAQLEGPARYAQHKTLREYLPELEQIFSDHHPDGLHFVSLAPPPYKAPRMMLVQNFPYTKGDTNKESAASFATFAEKFATTAARLFQTIRQHTHLALWRGALPEVWVE